MTMEHFISFLLRKEERIGGHVALTDEKGNSINPFDHNGPFYLWSEVEGVEHTKFLARDFDHLWRKVKTSGRTLRRAWNWEDEDVRRLRDWHAHSWEVQEWLNS